MSTSSSVGHQPTAGLSYTRIGTHMQEAPTTTPRTSKMKPVQRSKSSPQRLADAPPEDFRPRPLGLCQSQWMKLPPTAEPLTSARLLLEPLSVAHASSMVSVLADPSLYEFTGGEAPSLRELKKRYTAQVVGHSADSSQRWLNWIVTQRDGVEPVGFVQATVEIDGTMLTADMAWVISPSWQGRGFASEAAQAMLEWLRSNGVNRFTAHILPANRASMRVAQNQALQATLSRKDGEIRWESQSPPSESSGM